MPQIYQFTAADPYEAMQAGMEQARKNRLGDIDVAEKARAFEASKALNELYNKLVDPVTGQIDRNRLYGGMAARGYGGMIPGLQTAQAELEAKQAKSLRDVAESGKVTGETIQNRVKYWRDLIPSDPSMAPNWVAGIYSDPVVAPMLNQIGTPDQVIKSIPKDPAGYQKWAQQWSMGAEEFNKAMMPYVTPKSPEVMKQELAKAAAGKTSIDIGVSTAKKFDDTMAELAAKELGDLSRQAEAAVQIQNSSRLLKPLLDNPDFISGTLGDARLAVAKALGLPGAEETQTYFAGIGDQVAARVKAFGSGTGISDADRKFAEKIAGGSIELTPEAIRRIVKINNETATNSIKAYNKRREFLSKKHPEMKDYFPEIGEQSAAPEGGRTVVRTGTLNGKKVVQYSDGTTEYAP